MGMVASKGLGAIGRRERGYSCRRWTGRGIYLKVRCHSHQFGIIHTEGGRYGIIHKVYTFIPRPLPSFSLHNVHVREPGNQETVICMAVVPLSISIAM